MKLPHIPRRRDGDNKATKETDDITSPFTCIHENKLINLLPRFVSDNPDAMPPITIYEGDLHSNVKMYNALGDKVKEYGTMIAMLSRHMQEVQSRIALTWQPRPAQDTCRQHDKVVRPLPLVEFPIIEEANCVSQSADRAERQHQLDWATASTSTSTPFARSNSFAPLLITDVDEQNEH